MKNCAECDPAIHEGGCNWLDWMVDDAGGACPHCGGPVTEIETVTPLGRMLDQAIELTVTEVVYQDTKGSA